MSKIMVVEDDVSLREIYSVRITAEGYEVVSAGDGEEALAVAVREKPDLILSDVMMPRISGFDMLDIIRSTPETAKIKVIMMTALSSDEQRQRGESLGADRYLVKSQVGIEDVINAIHDVLGDKSATAPATPATAPATSATAPTTPATPAMPGIATTPAPVVPTRPAESKVATPTAPFGPNAAAPTTPPESKVATPTASSGPTYSAPLSFPTSQVLESVASATGSSTASLEPDQAPSGREDSQPTIKTEVAIDSINHSAPNPQLGNQNNE